MSRPFAERGPDYFRHGWSPIPVGKRPGEKWPPVTGWTGQDGKRPSAADVQAWVEDKGDLNVGLRMPSHILGVDIDNYGGKSGKATLAAAEDRWGALPDTWASTSREDGTSGIRLFRVPEGLAWPSELPGGGVEIIREAHRYAMVWPSIHPEGRVYEWIMPEGDIASIHAAIPSPDDLPDLPPAWVDGLTSGKLALDLARADLSDDAAREWIAEHGGGQMCGAMVNALKRSCIDMIGGGSRHDALTRGTARVAHLIQEGHPGGDAALVSMSQAFGHVTEHERRTGEVDRATCGAVRLAAAVGEVEPLDPCIDAFAVKRAGPLNVPPTPKEVMSTRDVFGGTADMGNLAPVVPITSAPTDPALDILVASELAAQRARRTAKRMLDDEDHVAAFRVPPYLASLTAELALPDEDVTYRVAEVLPVGGNVLLTASFKVGKTALINNLARSIADAEQFLGQLAIKPLGHGERVAVWNYEVDRGQYRRWLRDVGIENTDAVAVLNVRGYSLPITAPKVQDWIVEWLVAHGARVWFVDPFARAFTGTSENDNSEVGRWLDAVDVIKERAGVAELVLPTHTGRAEMEEGRERARGATRLDDWADVRWILTKNDEGQRFFSATGRDVDYSEKRLSFNESTRALTIAGGDRKTTLAERLQSGVIAQVRARGGQSTSELIDNVRGKEQSIRDAIKALHAAGHIRYEPGERNAKLWYPDTPPVFGA